MLDPNIRRCGIGGTDVAPILGVDDYRDAYAVWWSKRSDYQAPAPTPRMRLGKILERGIIDYYEEFTGRAVQFLDETYRHPERPWMIYTPDAICKFEPRGVDAKLVSWDQAHRWGDTADDIPARVQLQARWYMAATGYPVWDVVALLTTGDPLVYTIPRDLEFEGYILDRVEEFYRRYLIGDEEPPPGGSEETSRLIKERFPRHKADLRKATAAEAALLDDYAQARDEQAAATREKTRIEDAIKRAIADGEGLTWERGRFTWKNTADVVKVNWAELARSLMRGYSDDERAALEQQYAETRPGSRRIYFKCKEAAA